MIDSFALSFLVERLPVSFIVLGCRHVEGCESERKAAGKGQSNADPHDVMRDAAENW